MIGDDQELLLAAAKLVIETQLATPSFLARNLGIQHFDASNLLSRLAIANIVGPQSPSHPSREVICRAEKLDQALDLLRNGSY